MEINDIAAAGFATSMLAFSALLALLLSRWKGSAVSRGLAVAAGASAVWACLLAVRSIDFAVPQLVLLVVELGRGALWVAALLVVLRSLDTARHAERFMLRAGLPIFVVLLAILVTYSVSVFSSATFAIVASGVILLAILQLGLSEQVFRNLPSDSVSGLAYLCVAVLIMAGFDIFLYLQAINREMLVAESHAARGFVNALCAVPVAWAAYHSSRGTSEQDVPKQVVFYAFTLVATAVFVVLWLLADFYLKEYGGTWSEVASIVLIAAAICGLSIVLVSATIRSRVRVFLTKIFFQYKYDYRKEWLRFVGTLSESSLEDVPTTSVRAVAPIVNSPGGIVWIREHDGDDYVPVGSWRCDVPSARPINRRSSLVTFLRERQWVIDLSEFQANPSLYEGMASEAWFADRSDFWLVVPLLVGRRLFGFIVLLKPRFIPRLNFEDHDLLRMVGRHVGTHIKQAESDKRLAESGQFGTYHRLSAFLMHDLNNLIAQQSLVVKNAEKFRHDPQFVDDTIDTIAHSVERMRRLMEQLSSVSKTPQSTRTNIRDVLERAVRRSSPRKPSPELGEADAGIHVQADPERLTVVIEHLVRNAQDATEADGRITVEARAVDGLATVTVEDTGCGMEAGFIRERLFRPFDSTKGSQSMGIGAYQAREYVRMLGGQLEVESEVGRGTVFALRLPMAG